MNLVWLIIGVAVILVLFSSRNKGDMKPETKSNIRIDRPHVVDDDDYECSACHKRFCRNVMVCPYCGTRFIGRIEDTEEWDEEEDELEAWDEEDGV